MFFISKRRFEEKIWKEVDDLREKERSERKYWELAGRIASLEIEVKKLKGENVPHDVVAPEIF